MNRPGTFKQAANLVRQSLGKQSLNAARNGVYIARPLAVSVPANSVASFIVVKSCTAPLAPQCSFAAFPIVSSSSTEVASENSGGLHHQSSGSCSLSGSSEDEDGVSNLCNHNRSSLLSSERRFFAGQSPSSPSFLSARPCITSPFSLKSSFSSSSLSSLFSLTTSFSSSAGDSGEGEGLDANASSGVPPVSLNSEEYRMKHGIRVFPSDVPPPFQTFEDTNLPAALLDAFRTSGFTTPSTIQAQAWPILMQGRDIIAIASTGSGKTCGFVVPGILHTLGPRGTDPYDGPSMLILAPTRELAQQIQNETIKFGRPLGIRSACVYGGASRSEQGRNLQRRPHVVIATPGRLIDFVESGEINLSATKYLVLDEADRMLDMGFEQDIKDIVRNLPADRQTAFFSATWPTSVQSTAQALVRNRPAAVFIGDVQDKLVAAKTIKQMVMVVASNLDKFSQISSYISTKPPGSKFIIFCGTKSRCDMLSTRLNQTGALRSASLHGDKTQASRDFVLRQFREGRVPVLVATDVAARGLDVKDVTAVINYDFPNDVEMYVHRIGRTGRAGASGESLTLLTAEDAWAAKHLIQVMEEADQSVPEELMELGRMGKGMRKPGPQRRHHADRFHSPNYQRGDGGGSGGEARRFNNYRNEGMGDGGGAAGYGGRPMRGGGDFGGEGGDEFGGADNRRQGGYGGGGGGNNSYRRNNNNNYNDQGRGYGGGNRNNRDDDF
mmetsp:Transcript_24136/g.43178  ORF Transcript_24136/g.43178 Transcript_24136/m.43178 type:complete len:724 (-) Transcript_24136:257-2428(-)|eukprot:CAMPEP_0175050224 /NCGR_PEP_ID=MMETSP0052_2-20121109/7148_1 /TAXON_ID=51329 ORGANISM="Polytomella parva, Strain SAG 63-3" /NCGR_SAMPLE_ID=MMETSP0052_2 /ASSEMBLY_ACC=CAM_ASM_000194 /LENGTH=723 /DNA_ID=CAMNT_0016314419 /DNA_START=27 /DNA_END=2198 /DNA_ORIENTATION=+